VTLMSNSPLRIGESLKAFDLFVDTSPSVLDRIIRSEQALRMMSSIFKVGKNQMLNFLSTLAEALFLVFLTSTSMFIVTNS
jgi:hypothetical protein